jgi:hypothetical protein
MHRGTFTLEQAREFFVKKDLQIRSHAEIVRQPNALTVAAKNPYN